MPNGVSAKLIECPRDAMQGLPYFIPTEKKIRYLNSLLEVGFDTLDCGSFVSPKAIPQMADTAEVLRGLDLNHTRTHLLVIVANVRGAQQAVGYEQIRYLGFPFSVSETFQQRNAHASIDASLARVEEIQNLCTRHNKTLVVYLSMAFGNPYGDPWSPEVVMHWMDKLIGLEVKVISLADTIGIADAPLVRHLLQQVMPAANGVEVGLHLHTHPQNWREKMEAAWACGCRRYDGALRGLGGCPMAADQLVGNMPTENLISFFAEQGINSSINPEKLQQCLSLAAAVFQPPAA